MNITDIAYYTVCWIIHQSNSAYKLAKRNTLKDWDRLSLTGDEI